MWTNIARFRKIVYIGLLLLIPMFLLITQSRTPRLAGAISGKLVDVSVFLQSGVIFVFGGLSDFYYRYATSVNQFDAIHVYRAEAAQAATLKALLHELSLENNQLKALFFSAEEAGINYFAAARVTGRKGSPLSRIIYIDRGSLHGISRGDAVINNHGAVGQVVVAGKHSSEVLLVTDAASAVDVVVQSNRSRGILRGSGDPNTYLLEVRDFDHLFSVKAGETIVTSGLGAKFPVGVPVGEIISVEKGRDGMYLAAKIRPFVNFSQLEHVVVIKNNDNGRQASMGDLIKYMTTYSEPKL